MKKGWLNIIISLIILSLLGITGLQYFWISNAYRIKESQFDQGVRDAMQQVVTQLETREKVVFLSKEFLKDTINAIVKSMKSVRPGSEDQISNQERLREFRRMVDEGVLPPPPPPPGELEFRIGWDGNQEVITLSPPTIQDLGDYPGFPLEDIRPSREELQGNKSWFEHSGKTLRKNTPAELSIRKITENADRLKNIVDKMSIEIDELSKPIEKRIDITSLNNLLKASFSNKGIRVPFEFAIVSPYDTTKQVPVKSPFFVPDQLNSPYRVNLFPNDIFQKPLYLIVSFHGEKTQILKSFAWILFVSLFFTLVIIITSIISIFFMIRQKKISDIKTDFINNMTHEFKTPIATISIAADSINNPKVIDEPGRIRDYTKIIKEENQRMNTRVEQVLQMALIDSKGFRLRPEETDAHEVIRRAADHLQLIIARRDGILELNLEAPRSVIMADPDHFRNVIINLLDNANKYSPSRPEILVHTYNRSGKLFISIQDKGMGMNPETRRKVFDKFFRYSTGNIHNIKGFGLGLSYVKAIVMSLKGEIFVHSELGKGSRFDISMPLVDTDDEEFENEEDHGKEK